jgi:alpha-N-arabinofuranosidase
LDARFWAAARPRWWYHQRLSLLFKSSLSEVGVSLRIKTLQSFLCRVHFILLLGLFMVGAPNAAEAQIRAKLRVDPGTTLHSINPGIYGQFIEHFGRVVNGGVWAELLRNHKFYPVDPDRTNLADPWQPEHDRNAVSYVIDPSISLDGISSQRVTTFGNTHAWRGIHQTGFDLVGGKEYVAYAWILTRPGGGNVTFRLESAEGVVAAHVEVPLTPAAGEWKKYEVRLTPDRNLQSAVFHLAFDSTGENWVAAASLMPGDNVQGFRRDVLELVKAMGPPIIRWPGGGYADCYDWRKAIGPRDMRPPNPILPYGQPYGYDHGIDPSDVGTDEFLTFCRLIGAAPYINANFGSGSPEMAAQWVEYCNGTAESAWGQRRVANGHMEPYGVKNWAVGNEIWGSFEIGAMTAEGYATYFQAIAKAMRAADPSIQITAVGQIHDPDPKVWNETVLRQAGQQIDLLSVHHYFTGSFAPSWWLNNPLEAYQEVVAEPTMAERRAREGLAVFDRITGNGKKIQLAYDEWSEWAWQVPPPQDSPDRSGLNKFIDMLGSTGLDENQTWRDAMFNARMLQVLMRLGDRVPFAIRTHIVNSLGSIRTDSTRAYLTAPGKVMQLYRWHSGATLVNSEQQSPEFDVPAQGWKGISYLDSNASVSQDGRKLFLNLVNLHASEPLDVEIDIPQLSQNRDGDLWQIAPNDFISTNDFGVTNVDPAHEVKKGMGGHFTLRLPAHSVSVLELPMQ